MACVEGMSPHPQSEPCPVCQHAMSSGVVDWHQLCEGCGYESSSLLPTINAEASAQALNEASRAVGLKAVRQVNFSMLLDALRPILPAGRLLDVGCAHGWFLELAGRRYETLGVEPDRQVSEFAMARGLPVREGFFPDDLKQEETFDVIVFNDVIEHIPAISGVLDACRDRLNSGGVLVLNLPSSRGIFYQIATTLARLGLGASFERLWQKDMPSPHVHYFDPKTLKSLVERHGFTEVRQGTLPTLVYAGLYSRIAYAGGSPVIHGIKALVISMMIPFLGILPADIMFAMYRRDARE